jgi:AmmeMemoRadiSam system protein B
MARRPRVRPLEPLWTEHEGEKVLVLRDRSGVSDQPLAVPPVVGFILSMCDGNRDEEAIRAPLKAEVGQEIAAEELSAVLDQLERALILEGPACEDATRAALETYRSAPARAASLAGAVYPAETGACREAIAAFGRSEPNESSRWDDEVRGVLSPHIDYQRGGRIYHRVWSRAAPAVRSADVVVIFGTDHGGGSATITPTRQHYDTPFGPLETDRAAVDAIADAIGAEAAFAEELHHKGEHSIELAAVWTASLLGEKRPTIVPVLCGSFFPYTHEGGDPSREARFAAAIDALKAATTGRRVVAVAAGDLAHVGPAFGDPSPYDAAAKERLRAADERLLHAAAWGRAAEFVDQLRSERDARRICGLPPVYLMLRYLGEDARGEVVGYDQCPADADGGSLVSVAGMLLW